jgi:hypothetical protein
VATNLVMFLLPAVACGVAWGSCSLLTSAAVFALAGVLIGPSLEKRLLGVPRGVLFNISLGIASLLMSSRLVA